MNSAVWSIAPVLAAQIFVAAAFFLPAPDGGAPAVPARAAAPAAPEPVAVAATATREARTPEARPVAPASGPPMVETVARAAPAWTPPDGTAVHPPLPTVRHPDIGVRDTLVASRRQTPAWTPPDGTAIHPPAAMARHPDTGVRETLVASRRSIHPPVALGQTGLSADLPAAPDAPATQDAPDAPRGLPTEPPAGTGGRVAAPPSIVVPPSGPAPGMQLATGWLERARRHTETVMPGDSLWRIAGRRYGEGLAWSGLWRANRVRIVDPDLIYPGQVLLLP